MPSLRTDIRAPAPSTPRRVSRLYHIRGKNTSPGNSSPSHDELDTQACETEKFKPNDGATPDEIVVSSSPQDTNDTGVAVADKSAGRSGLLGRSSRASSISQSGSPTSSSPGRVVSMKKQDFVVDIAANNDGTPDELSDVPTSKKRRVDPTPVPRVAFRKSRSKWDNADEMLTNPNSPLANAKLRELLCTPTAWDILTAEERDRILAKFPDDTQILDPGTPDARPDVAALLSNDNFRHDVERYKERLGKGFHDPEWIRQAQAAHRSRQAGLYDGFLATDFEDKWGMPMIQQSPAESELGGESSRLTDHDSDAQEDNTPVEPEVTVPSKDMAGLRGEMDDTPKLRPATASRGNSIDVSMQGQNDKIENATDSEATAHSTFEAKGKTTDRSPKSDGAEAELAQVEDLDMEDATAPGGRQTGISNHAIETSNLPPSPESMKGVEW